MLLSRLWYLVTHEWVTFTMSCSLHRPAQLLLTPAYVFCHGVNPPLLWSSSFPALLSFPMNSAFSWWARSQTASVLSLLPPAMLQVWFAVGPSCLFFWWTRSPTELASNITIQMNQYSACKTKCSQWRLRKNVKWSQLRRKRFLKGDLIRSSIYLKAKPMKLKDVCASDHRK